MSECEREKRKGEERNSPTRTTCAMCVAANLDADKKLAVTQCVCVCTFPSSSPPISQCVDVGSLKQHLFKEIPSSSRGRRQRARGGQKLGE